MPRDFRPHDRVPPRESHDFRQPRPPGAPQPDPAPPQAYRDPRQTGGWQAYRDPWQTGGWFARVLQERGSAAQQPRFLSSAGSPWAIVVILLVQAVLSIRLLGANTGFRDEGLYVWAGYLEVSHQISLSQLQGLASWFSGSPEMYPPAGALAAQSGGLAGARLLSLAFMLFSTVTLYAVARRLWSSRMPAIFAAALFGWLGSVQFLGSFATYDAMALPLLASATWLYVRAIPCRMPRLVMLLTAASICLLAANATGYWTVLYDPVVIAIFTLAAWRVRRWTVALGAGSALAVTVAAVAAGAYLLAGSAYRAGVKSSVLTQAPGHTLPGQVLTTTGRWIGLLLIVAIAAAIAITLLYRNAATALLAWVLVIAAVLAPIQDARTHTTVSLYEQAGFGAWFACAAAGWILAYAFDAQKRGGEAKATRFGLIAGRGVAILATVASALAGVASSATQFHSWPNSTAAVAELTRLAKPNGEYLAEDYGQFAYHFRDEIPLPQWWDTRTFRYRDPRTKKQLTNVAAYAAAIRDRYFTVIVLDFQDNQGAAAAIEQDIRKYHDYRLVATIPFTTSAGRGKYLFWAPAP